MENGKIDPEIDPEKAFNEVFEQALIILKETIECVDKPPNPDAPMGIISEHMVMLDRHVRDFLKANQEVIDEAKRRNIEQGKDTKAELSKETQRLVKRSEELIQKSIAKQEEIAERVRQGLEAAEEDAAKDTPKKSNASKEEPRKNKFRRVGGGNKNWKPL